MRRCHSLTDEKKYEALNDILEKSSCIAFLGGAGVSTESGIPDFRSKNGLYHKSDKKFRRYRPEYLLSSECLHRESEVFFSYYRKNLDARKACPNVTHIKLAEMERKGKLAGIVTQNIDGLHQIAGSKTVHEIHGTVRRNYCVSCGKEYDENYIFDSTDPVPKCTSCGKMVRPDVTLYGEILPSPAYENAVDLMNRADCLIIGGTSLQVGSAAQMAHLFHGDHLIIVNKGKTRMEGKAELVFHESIGFVFDQIW